MSRSEAHVSPPTAAGRWWIPAEVKPGEYRPATASQPGSPAKGEGVVPCSPDSAVEEVLGGAAPSLVRPHAVARMAGLR